MASNAYEFTETLQEKILTVLWRDPLNYAMYHECIKPRYFKTAVHNDICRIMFDYYERYKVSPTLEVLIQEVDQLITGSKAKSKLEQDFVNTLTNMSQYDLADLPYVKDKIVEFGKRQAMVEAVVGSAEIVEKGGDFGKVENMIKDALLVGQDISNLGTDFWEGMEERIQGYETQEDVIERITTGSNLLNEILKGGLGKTEMGVVIAPPGRGKTTMLINLGAEALKAGYNVVHYSFENNEKQILRNYDLRMVEKDFDYTRSNTSKVIQALKNRQKISKGNLVVKKYPPKSTTVNTIRSHLRQLEVVKGFKPDMLIIDYGALMRSTQQYKEKRDELETVYTEIRALADEFDCAVWTAAQGNRSSLSKKIVTISDLAECFAIANVADFMIALCQTKREKLKAIMRFFIAKNRDNKDYMTLVGKDMRDIKKMTIDSEVTDEDEDDDEYSEGGGSSWED